MVNLPIGAISLLVADTAPSVQEPLPGWAQYGILGLIIISWLTGFIVRGKDRDQAIKERDEERKRTDAAEAASKSLMMEKIFPALTAYQLALQNVNDVMVPTMERMADRLDSMEKRLNSDRQVG